MVVTPYLYRAHGFQHPAFRLRRLGPYGVFASFADQFETIWASATPSGLQCRWPTSRRRRWDEWTTTTMPTLHPPTPLCPGRRPLSSTTRATFSCSDDETMLAGRCPGRHGHRRKHRSDVIREVQEETGLEVEPEYIVGVYSDPAHVFAYDDGEVRQQFSVCFACSIVGGQVETSDESSRCGSSLRKRSTPWTCMSQSASGSGTTWSRPRAVIA